MKRVHDLQGARRAEQLHELLESQAIPCFVRHRSLRLALGTPGAAGGWLELWVKNDADAVRARALIAEAERAIGA